ncbi:hypothetical protein CIRG_09471 [Coccidioides immitis RMSCC 2394]|uniref:Zn(2)-C6 fungal-type domain-containing protein n=1 Tax=Coccidioides immitis RMSCC 2394 TaxID=404692 RepID=A0A0J6YKX6_COCIT|nr:hypothetical protein CIRG_09471 [Coccidioides immitis RMSCC 2394]
MYEVPRKCQLAGRSLPRQFHHRRLPDEARHARSSRSLWAAISPFLPRSAPARLNPHSSPPPPKRECLDQRSPVLQSPKGEAGMAAATLEEIPAVMLMVDTCASGEEKPVCVNCQRQGDTCDYSIRLNWEGRGKKKSVNPSSTGTTVAKSVATASGGGGGGEVAVQASASSPLRRPTAEGVQPNRLVNDKLWGDVRHASPTENGKRSGPRDSSNTPGGTLFSSTDSSDTTSEEAYPPHQQVLGHQDASARPELQRVSVQSLLSHSIADGALPPSADICPTTRENSASVIVTGSSETAVSFGFDCGRVDLDINRNDDSAAIEYKIATLQLACPVTSPTMTSSSTDSERDTKKRVTALFTKGGYYARPRVKFPRPSPPKLDHTRRAVSNSEDTVAVQDINLLNLLLAYSASHRARLLGHAEPYNRIAHWTRHVFPKLRHALDDPNEKISETNLATAIMLASLKIISPSTFEVPIPWESHLKLARGLFLARRQMQIKYSSDQVEFFLCRWLGYLDILGSLSSRQTEPPLLGGNYWSTVALDEPQNPGSDLEIDCFTGFTLECRSFFVRLAELIHECDVCQVDPVTGRPISAWTPPPLILTRAERLLFDMTSSRSRNYHHRTHHGLPELGDMAALDDSYRLTGIVQLYRRVFCLSASDTKVVESVNMLIDSLDRVSRGGATEVCALLPLFTAGCETRDTTQRQAIRARFKGFEGVGMKQIRRARKLMQRSWQENLPWTMLANAFEDKAIPIIKHRDADQACRRGFDVQCARNIQ